MTPTTFVVRREEVVSELSSLVHVIVAVFALGVFFPYLLYQNQTGSVALAGGCALIGAGLRLMALPRDWRFVLPIWATSWLDYAQTIFMFGFFGAATFFGASASRNDYQETPVLIAAFAASAVVARVGHLIVNRVFRVNTHVLGGWPMQYLRPLR